MVTRWVTARLFLTAAGSQTPASILFRAWLSQALASSSMSGLKILLCRMGRPGQRSKTSTGVG